MKRKHNAAPLGANEYSFQIGSDPPFEAFDTVTTEGQEERTEEAGKATQEFAGKDGIPGGPVNSYEANHAPAYSRLPKSGGE